MLALWADPGRDSLEGQLSCIAQVEVAVPAEGTHDPVSGGTADTRVGMDRQWLWRNELTFNCFFQFG